MDAELRERIERWIADLDDPESEARKRFEAESARVEMALVPLQDAIDASERITWEDLNRRMTI